MKSGIYIIKNLINRKVYVGSSINIYHRKYTHFSCLKRNKHLNNYLQNAFNKYGKDNFEFYVLEFIEENKLIAREQYWIDYYDATNRKIGYNIAPLASGSKLSEETKKKISKTIKDSFKNGRINSFKGKKHTKEAKKIIGQKSSQKVFTKEFKDNLLKASNYACYKPIIQLDKKGNFIAEHKSINKAVKYLFPKISEKEIMKSRKGTSIGRVCNGKSKTAFGFIFKFKK